ncbi:MAG: mandelate racemase/muconate lactonizing enzyme family protein [Opitutaceae bacterium]
MISRRQFLQGSGLLAAGALAGPIRAAGSVLAAPSGKVGSMKIASVKTAAIDIKYKTHLVKVTTDSGLFGIGEAYPKAEVADDIALMGRKIIGEDPLNVESLVFSLTQQFWSRGSRTGSLCGAIAGIETALYDLAGKILGIPVYVLLGGTYHDRILLYNDADSPDSKTFDAQAWAATALASKEAGFRAVKHSLPKYDSSINGTITPGTLRKWVRILEATVDALGDDTRIGVDLHWKYQSVDVLRFTHMIRDLNIWFLEDPIQPEDIEGHRRIKEKSVVPILTGENLYHRQGFRQLIETQACDMVHIDAQKSGGLLEMKKIADWADLYSMPMICHNGATPVGTIASAHACRAIKSFVALEADTAEGDKAHWPDLIHHEGPLFRDGYLEVSDRPGLGIELNEDVCREHLADDRGFFE